MFYSAFSGVLFLFEALKVQSTRFIFSLYNANKDDKAPFIIYCLDGVVGGGGGGADCFFDKCLK